MSELIEMTELTDDELDVVAAGAAQITFDDVYGNTVNNSGANSRGGISGVFGNVEGNVTIS